MSNGQPGVIKIDLDFLRTSLCVALDEMHTGMNDYIKQEIQRTLSEGHLTSLIQMQVMEGLRRSVGLAVTNYFQFGEGKEAIESVIKSRLAGVMEGLSKGGI